MKAYHASNVLFTSFDSNYTETMPGLWFTEDTDYALEYGEYTYKCKECGKTYTVEGKDHNHDMVKSAEVEPTCRTNGVAKYTCSICGLSYEGTESMLGHKYEEVKDMAVEPSCKKAEQHTYKCTRCGDTFTMTSNSKFLAHMVDYETKYVECTDGGPCLRYSYCKTCGEAEISYQAYHYTRETIKAPTATEPGIDRFTCKYCHGSMDVEIPALNDLNSDIENNYTITKQDDTYVYTCKKCGEYFYYRYPSTTYDDGPYHRKLLIKVHDCEAE